MNFLIVTGERGSGKTHYITSYLSSLHETPAQGITSPDINQQRVLLFHPEKQQIPFQITDPNLFPTVSCIGGHFYFEEKAFDQALDRFLPLSIPPNGVFVVDELGPLELRKHQGFYPLYQQLLAYPTPYTLVLSVRPSLLSLLVGDIQSVHPQALIRIKYC